VSRRARTIAWLVAVAAAAVGGVLYVAFPGVATYQASGVLVAPLALAGLIVLHRRLPLLVQWVVAVALAAVGISGYLVFSGPLWWNFGQLAVLPLAALAMSRTAGLDGSEPSGPSPGGIPDGQWGPP
jgi:hypothetical protein